MHALPAAARRAALAASLCQGTSCLGALVRISACRRAQWAVGSIPGPKQPLGQPSGGQARTPPTKQLQHAAGSKPTQPKQQQQQPQQPVAAEPVERSPPGDSTPAAAASNAAAGRPQDELQCYSLSERQQAQLHTYLDYMLEINQSMNLTAVRDREEAWHRHIMDSLALLPIIDKHVATLGAVAGPGGDAGSGTSRQRSGAMASSSAGGGGSWVEVIAGEAAAGDQRQRGQMPGAAGQQGPAGAAAAAGTGVAGAAGQQQQQRRRRLTVIDVGTGAGLPGMVLAVARPEWKVTLLDSLRKRCDFLREAAARAGLTNVEVVWSRAEEAGQKPELRQAFDLAVARAVAEARVLSELCLPFVRVGGLWVAAKGPNPQEEVAAANAAIRQLGGRALPLELVASHSAEGQRTALVVAKVAPTSPKYPRAPGTPSKKPL